MLRRLFLFFFPLALCFAYAAHSTAPQQRVPFTPLHVYYMSPTGSDSNNGTSPSDAWATPNHPVSCGDVIIAEPGSYNSGGMSVTSQPTDCPSTSGGIDSTGGVYFAVVLCNGKLGACYIDDDQSNANGAIDDEASNWAFEGWQVSSTGIGTSVSRGFQATACKSDTERIAYIAFINDVVTHANQAYDTNDCGMNHNVPGNGVDYFAVVGSIAQDANSAGICLAAIDDVGPANTDTKAGVHVFFDGNFAIANQLARPGCGYSDGEAMMFDTWDAHGYVGTGVIKDNILYSSSWANLQVFMQKINSSAPYLDVFDNTSYHSNVCVPFSASSTGGMNFQLDGGFPWTINVFNNIDYEDFPNNGCRPHNPVYAMLVGGSNPGPGATVFNAGGVGLRNIFKGSQTSCALNRCDSGNNVEENNGFSYGINIYRNPRFANTADLLRDWSGAPTCSSYTNTSACMGWKYSTQTASPDTVIGDLIPRAPGAKGKGYQPPRVCGDGTSFVGSISGSKLTVDDVSGVPIGVGQLIQGPGVPANTIITGGSGPNWTVNNSRTVHSESMGATYYPYWLKGINYLQVKGTRLYEYNGLTNKPCGM